MSALPWIVLLKSVVIQLGTLASAIIIFRIVPLGPVGIVMCAVLVAVALSYALRLPLSWVVFNAALPPMAAVSLGAAVPSWIFLVGFLLLLGFHLPALWTHVPYYPTPPESFGAIAELLPDDREFSFLEIGSGVGALLAFLADERPKGEFIGVEISIIPFLMSKLRTAHRPNVAIHFQSLWNVDFSPFQFIYAFLSPAPMEALWKKFTKEAQRGALLVSNSFKAPSIPERIAHVSDARGGVLYVYRA